MFSDITEAWDKDPVKEITQKITQDREKKIDKYFPPATDAFSFDLSDIGSISMGDNFSYEKYAPVEYSQPSSKKKSHHKPKTVLSDTDTIQCSHSINHLRSCDTCHHKLKSLIDTKVNKKFNEMILDNKMREIQNMTLPKAPVVTTNGYWKEIAIGIFGVIIIMVLILLIVKAIR